MNHLTFTAPESSISGWEPSGLRFSCLVEERGEYRSTNNLAHFLTTFQIRIRNNTIEIFALWKLRSSWTEQNAVLQFHILYTRKLSVSRNGNFTHIWDFDTRKQVSFQWTLMWNFAEVCVYTTGLMIFSALIMMQLWYISTVAPLYTYI